MTSNLQITILNQDEQFSTSKMKQFSRTKFHLPIFLNNLQFATQTCSNFLRGQVILYT